MTYNSKNFFSKILMFSALIALNSCKSELKPEAGFDIPSEGAGGFGGSARSLTPKFQISGGSCGAIGADGGVIFAINIKNLSQESLECIGMANTVGVDPNTHQLNNTFGPTAFAIPVLLPPNNITTAGTPTTLLLGGSSPQAGLFNVNFIITCSGVTSGLTSNGSLAVLQCLTVP